MAGLFDAVSGSAAFIPGERGRRVHRVRHGNDCIRVDAADEVSVVINLSEAHRAVRRSDGRRDETDPRVGAVTLVPPGCPTAFELSGIARVLMLQLPWAEIARWHAEAHDGASDRIEFRPRLAVEDPDLARLFYAAAACPDDGEEAFIRAIAERLFSAHAARFHPARVAAGGLSPARLRRVRERIEADLENPLTLTGLAGEAGMSVFHFAREFRRVTGLPPHRYLLRRRLDHAVILLADRDLAMADIAAATGFSHASHLAKHLRRQTGLTPGVFRGRVIP